MEIIFTPASTVRASMVRRVTSASLNIEKWIGRLNLSLNIFSQRMKSFMMENQQSWPIEMEFKPFNESFI